jgi:hypothetical protein
MITQVQGKPSDEADSHIQSFLDIVAAELAERWIEEHQPQTQVRLKDSAKDYED